MEKRYWITRRIILWDDKKLANESAKRKTKSKLNFCLKKREKRSLGHENFIFFQFEGKRDSDVIRKKRDIS